MGCERESNGGPQPLASRTVYSAPRRYDIATLLAVVFAYAMLFGAMRLMGSSPTVFAMAAALFTCVGAGQALLFGGKSPRAASVLVGAAYWIAIAAVASRTSVAFTVPGATGALISGAISGYVAGVVIGAVFMAADAARKVMKRTTSDRDK